MIIPDQGRPSYARGFARSQAEAVYPGLWQGLQGWWQVTLGAKRTTLGDVSGHGNHGTLTNMEMADWVSSVNGGALQFDGSDERVVIDKFYGNGPKTILWRSR